MHDQDKELFQGYEIKNWNYSPRLYKILGAAAAFNLLAFFVMGQTNLLTTRGCDSPFVGRVCQVIDTIYVASAVFGTGSEFESRDYEKTELEDADITYIDVSGQSPPLTYPEGYFALANPEEFAAMQQMQNMNNDFSMMPSPNISGFPTNPIITDGTDLMSQPQVTPTPNKNAVTGKIPDSPFSMGGPNPIATTPPITNKKYPRVYTPRRPRPSNISPKKLPDLENKTTAGIKDKPKETEDVKPQPDITSLPVDENKLNKKPLEDFGGEILAKLADEKKKLDLTKSFLVVMDGTITKDGKLDKDPKKSKFIKNEGDQEMIDVAKSAIEAVGDSGLLGYLRDLGVEKVQFTLVQNDKEIYAVITSDQKSEARAKTVSSGLNTLISIAKGNVKEEDVKALLNSAKVEQKGKNFVFNFVMPKPLVQEMINRKLQEAEAKKKAEENKPNSTAQTDNANLKTTK